MSTNLDGVIRPFQLPEFTPSQISPDSRYAPNRNPIISVGAQGSVKTWGGSFSLTETYYQIEYPKEIEQDQQV